MNKYVVLLIILLTGAGCYRPKMERPVGLPVYEVYTGRGYLYGHGGQKDTPIVFEFIDSAQWGIRLSFSLKSGDPVNYPVSCYLSGLPVGIEGTNDTFNFRLSKEVVFPLSVKTDTGIYPVSINVVTPDEGRKEYAALIHVLPVPDCAERFPGTYTGQDPCGHGGGTGQIWYNYTATISMIPGSPHWIRIKNFHGFGDSIEVDAHIDCNGSIEYPLQTTHGYTIYGKGYYYETDIHSNRDTVVHDGDTISCYMQLKKQ